jgi:preprotein translocase subunit SecF
MLKNLSKVFFILFIICALVCVMALRHNNETMVKLRQQIYAADQSGNGVDEALNKLRAYVYSHMNTDLKTGNGSIKEPIQLKYTYERAQQAESARIKAINDSIRPSAESACNAQHPVDTQTLTNCVQDYISKHGGQREQPVPPALYQFDFVSPTWSPDLAGFSMIAAFAFFGAFLIALAVKFAYLLRA